MIEAQDSHPGLNGNSAPVALKDRVKELQLTGKLDGAKSPNSGGSAWLPWTLCVLLAISWAGVGFRWYAAKPAQATENPIDPATLKGGAGPDTKQAAKGEVVLESTGYVIPTHSISISPIDVSGRIITLNIQEGMTFQKGDVLAVLDDSSFKADLSEAEAQEKASKARWQELEQGWETEKAQAEAESADAKAQFEEMRSVYDTNKSQKGSSIAVLDVVQSQKKYEAALHRLRAAEKKADLVKGDARIQKMEALKGDFEAAKARLARAKWREENCTLKAPVTGVILHKNAEEGNLINPVVGGVSTSLCDMADLSLIEVDLDIQERDVAKIKQNMRCEIRPNAFPSRVYEGYVYRMMPVANRAKGIVPVRARILPRKDEKQGEYLKPDMAVSVAFLNDEIEKSKILADDLNRQEQVTPFPGMSKKASDAAEKKK